MKVNQYISSAVALLATSAFAVDITSNPDLVAKLKAAATNRDRMALLPNNSDWFFDFTQQTNTYTFTPGGVTNANAATFPAVVGYGMTLATLNLGACSLLPAHLHPRANNFVVAIKGTTHTIMVAENGVQTIQETLNPGQMTIFPAGSIHTMMNIGCEDAQLISALSSEDAGTLNVANTFFNLPEDYAYAAMGEDVVGQELNLTSIQATIPPVGTGSVYGLEACRAKCSAQKMAKRSNAWRRRSASEQE